MFTNQPNQRNAYSWPCQVQASNQTYTRPPPNHNTRKLVAFDPNLELCKVKFGKCLEQIGINKDGIYHDNVIISLLVVSKYY